MKEITALQDTYLKKTTGQAEELADDQKVLVSASKKYPIENKLAVEGMHTQYELGYGAGIWWIFDPHWQTQSDKLTATFTLKQAKSSSIIYGSLSFSNGMKMQATSGQPGYQYSGAHTIRGKGCIPPGEWKIATGGYYCGTSGIEGMFYHITPDPHPATGRSEIGLHRDANVSYSPGSAGCIVVSTADLNSKIIPLMQELSAAQSQVPLLVQYT